MPDEPLRTTTYTLTRADALAFEQASSRLTPLGTMALVLWLCLCGSATWLIPADWAGSHLGWRAFSAATPNDGHRTLAALERAGVVTGVITQNVDGLHLRAGSRRVVEIHGSMDRAVCLRCGQVFSRADLAATLDRDNAWIDEPGSVQLQPDGDVEITDVGRFRVPDCSVCGGVLKPDVVFFGEFVPTEKFDEAVSIVADADALLVVGSSLTVNSGVRLVDHAVRRKHPVVIVNRGETRSDRRAAVKLDAGTTETLVALGARLTPSAMIDA